MDGCQESILQKIIYTTNMQAIHSRPYQKMRSKNSPYPKNKVLMKLTVI